MYYLYLTYRVLQVSCYAFTFDYFRLKLNIVQTFAHLNKCHCITYTIYIYKRLLGVKYRLMAVTRMKTFTLLHTGFKKTQILWQLNISE